MRGTLQSRYKRAPTGVARYETISLQFGVCLLDCRRRQVQRLPRYPDGRQLRSVQESPHRDGMSDVEFQLSIQRYRALPIEMNTQNAALRTIHD